MFTTLNIFGLAVSISACWVIYKIVDYEFSYDRSNPNRNNIYRVVTGFVFDEKQSFNGGVSAPLYQAVKQQVGGLDYAVPVLGKWLKAVEVNTNTGKHLIDDDPGGVVATDATYFNMVPYHWLVGNKVTALVAPENVVLTESRAKKYFPGKKLADIINKTLTYYSYRDTVQRTVTGIVADLPMPTEFTAQEFCTLPTKPYQLNAWTNTNGSDKVYLQLKQGTDPNKVVKHIEMLAAQKMKEFEQKSTNNFKFKRWYELMPLKNSHFSTYVEEYNTRKASKPVLYGLVGISMFLLLLACINYVNISIASMPQRAKEIGVRKTLGGRPSQLIAQFLSETLFTTFFAAMLAKFLSLLAFWMLTDIIPPGITPAGGTLQLITFMLFVCIFVTLLAGIYPAWLITKVKTINVFRNFSVVKNSSQQFSIQKGLIVFQFVIAIVFITGAVIVGNQLHYTLKTDMGFNKDAVVLVDVPWKYANEKKYEGKQFPLFNEIKAIPGVQNVSLGSAPMEKGYSSSQYEYKQAGKEAVRRQVFKKWVDTNYIGLYGMKLIAGRNLQASDTTNEFVINETAVHAFGFASAQQALGKLIGQTDEKFPIVGVVRDFHLQNFYKSIDPMAFESEKDNLSSFNIKLQGTDAAQWQATLKVIEKKWYQIYPPDTFSFKFYDETLQAMYEQELHLAKLVNLATAISILISCLGLFGLAVLTAFQRTKEIGIRKVLGASVPNIVRLLSKEYLRLVIIAIVVATPIAWWAMHKWLENFAYRIQIQWWMFMLAGVAGIAIAFITVGFHALKAAMANPVNSLRSE